MAAPLRQENFEQHQEEQQIEQRYHVFQDFSQNAKFRELVFFARIAFFTITTVFLAFGLLALNLPTILVFLFAILISLAITSTMSTFIWHLLK